MGISSPSDNILLIGFMGSGKSTVGRYLAKILNFQFIDTDTLIESAEGMSISEIFNIHGEAHFRTLERQLLDWITNFVSHAVISTGGGLPIHNTKINKAGFVIYLEADFELINKRMNIEESSKRPLFQDINKAKLLFDERVPIYKKYADLSVNVEGDIERIVRTITDKLEKQ